MSEPIKTWTDVHNAHADWALIGRDRASVSLRLAGDPYAYPGGALVVLSLIPADSEDWERVWQVWDVRDDGTRSLAVTRDSLTSAKHAARVNQSIAGA